MVSPILARRAPDGHHRATYLHPAQCRSCREAGKSAGASRQQPDGRGDGLAHGRGRQVGSDLLLRPCPLLAPPDPLPRLVLPPVPGFDQPALPPPPPPPPTPAPT